MKWGCFWWGTTGVQRFKYVFVWKQMYKTFEPTHSQIFDLSVIVRIIIQIEDLAVSETCYQAQIPL